MVKLYVFSLQAAVAYLRVLSRNSTGRTKESHKNVI